MTDEEGIARLKTSEQGITWTWAQPSFSTKEAAQKFVTWLEAKGYHQPEIYIPDRKGDVGFAVRWR